MKSTLCPYIRARILFIVPVILALVMVIPVSNAYGGLVFFRATDDKQTYAKNPRKYERVVISFPQTREKIEVYVETMPVLRIDLGEINSVVIEKEEFLGLRPRKAQRQNEPAVDYGYSATFYLTEQGAKRFNDFAQRHDRELFDLRFETKKRLGVGRILGPLVGSIFTAGLEETNVDRLREVFSPIKDKVTWK